MPKTSYLQHATLNEYDSFQGISICTNDYLLNRYKIECHIPNSSYVSPDITFNSVESDYNYLEYPDVMEQLLFN